MKDVNRVYARRDSFKSRKKIRRRARQAVRHMNRYCENEFQGRFSARIEQEYMRPYEDNSGWDCWFVVRFLDQEYPELDMVRCYDKIEMLDYSIFGGLKTFARDMNDLIVKSDYWEKH